MRDHRLLAFLLAAALPLLAGCATARQQSLTRSLQDDVRMFFRSQQDQQWINASKFLPPEQRAEALLAWEKDEENLKLADFDIEAVLPIDEEAVEVLVRVQQYSERTLVVKDIKCYQIWEYSGDEHWLMIREADQDGREDFEVYLKEYALGRRARDPDNRDQPQEPNPADQPQEQPQGEGN